MLSWGLIFLLFIGMLWWWRYHHNAVCQPKLVYRQAPLNQQILARLPRLYTSYRPTPWAFNTHLQLLILLAQGALSPLRLSLRRQVLTMSDGGTTALDWLDVEQAADDPTIVVIHTIAGTRRSMRHLMSDLHRLTGWRVVLCTRRGHDGLPMTVPRYNTMGDTQDLREQLSAIRQRFPESPLYGVGSSAGSGLLVRYLGEEKSNSQLATGIAYCPGYDISVAFSRAHSFYSRYVTSSLKEEFLAPHEEAFRQFSSFAPAMAATNLVELQNNIHHIAGYASTEDYLEHANPMNVMGDITVPLLAINADDDPLCVVDNVIEHEDFVRQMHNAILVRTTRGSHCAFYQGWRPTSWSHQLMADYLLAVHTIQQHK